MEHAVAEARARLQEADRVQELDRRLPVLLEDVVELALVHRGVQLYRHVEVVGPPPGLLQEIRRARVELAGIEHGLDPAVVRAVVLLDVGDRALEPGHAGGLIPLPDDAAAVEGVAGRTERRPHVRAHAELARDLRECAGPLASPTSMIVGARPQRRPETVVPATSARSPARGTEAP